MPLPILDQKLPKVTTKSLIAFTVIFGYVLAIGTLAYLKVPNGQLDILDKALVGLGTLAGAIVNGLFNGERRHPDDPPI